LGRKFKASKEEKIQACKDYINGSASNANIGKSLGVAESTVRKWVKSYRIHGDEAFNYRSYNRTYSISFKKMVIERYLSGESSSTELAAEYLLHQSMVMGWVNSYNDGIDIKEYNPTTEVYTMKNRKTTFDERLEIVKYVISNDNNYKKASLKYGIPYPSVNKWTKVYLEKGKNGLRYKKRGPKIRLDVDLNSMGEIEKLKYKLKREIEKRELAELKLEILKKKEELEQKSNSRK